MTRDEIMNMQAGEEMDDLIAIHVMKWHKKINNGFIHWVDKDGRYQHRANTYRGVFEDEEDFHTIIFHPSESIKWAWDVVNRMGSMWMDATMPEYGIDVEFTKGNTATAETAPLAICRAALLSVCDG